MLSLIGTFLMFGAIWGVLMAFFWMRKQCGKL